MEDNIIRIEYRGKKIILIATAHVLKESAELVKKVIMKEKPDSICIELDEERYQNIQNPKAWGNTDIIKVIKSKKVGLLLANLLLSSYQKKIAQKLNSNVGQEMLQGIESARATGAELVLADRNIQTTFLRIWRKLSFLNKCKLLFSLFFSFEEDTDISHEDLNELMKKDMLESAMSAMRKQLPQIGEILIGERDKYLAFKIKNASGQKIVAILGAAHVTGVKEAIFEEQDIESITKVRPKSIFSKIIGWTIPVLIVSLIIYGFIINIQTGVQQITSWILWNGILAALFTVLSFGHPLSIITAFVVAPISSLNPLLACGWFAGIAEATIRKPTVQDVNNISTDFCSLKGFVKNRFLRTLLIVIMANIGSSIGTVIGGIEIVQNLMK